MDFCCGFRTSKNIDEIDIYKYTPYTCASNESTHSANVLFLEIYNGKMLSNFPL